MGWCSLATEITAQKTFADKSIGKNLPTIKFKKEVLKKGLNIFDVVPIYVCEIVKEYRLQLLPYEHDNPYKVQTDVWSILLIHCETPKTHFYIQSEVFYCAFYYEAIQDHFSGRAVLSIRDLVKCWILSGIKCAIWVHIIKNIN